MLINIINTIIGYEYVNSVIKWGLLIFLILMDGVAIYTLISEFANDIKNINRISTLNFILKYLGLSMLVGLLLFATYIL